MSHFTLFQAFFFSARHTGKKKKAKETRVVSHWALWFRWQTLRSMFLETERKGEHRSLIHSFTHSCIHSGLSVLFFPLATSSHLLFLFPLFFQVFLHSHSQATVTNSKKNRNRYIKGFKQFCFQDMCTAEDCDNDTGHAMILPPGLFFLHIFPAALHEF